MRGARWRCPPLTVSDGLIDRTYRMANRYKITKRRSTSRGWRQVKLRRPTDFLILESLEESGRNVATNLSYHTGKSRKNINARLPVLDDYGLVRKIGPSDRSGLYEITDLGRKAIQYRDLYGEVDDFEALLTESDIDSAAPKVRARIDRGRAESSTD